MRVLMLRHVGGEEDLVAEVCVAWLEMVAQEWSEGGGGGRKERAAAGGRRLEVERWDGWWSGREAGGDWRLFGPYMSHGVKVALAAASCMRIKRFCDVSSMQAGQKSLNVMSGKEGSFRLMTFALYLLDL